MDLLGFDGEIDFSWQISGYCWAMEISLENERARGCSFPCSLTFSQGMRLVDRAYPALMTRLWHSLHFPPILKRAS
jgi:hypothetical protein